MPKIIGDIKLYSVLELSALLKITSITLRKYIKNGRIQAQKIGGAYHITEDNFKSFCNGTLDNTKKTKD